MYYVCRDHYEWQLTFFILNSTILGGCFNLQERRGREGGREGGIYTDTPSTIYGISSLFSCKAGDMFVQS